MKLKIRSWIAIAVSSISALFAVIAIGLYFTLSISAFSRAPLVPRPAVPINGKDLADFIKTCRIEKTSCHAYPLAVATGSLTTSRLLEAPDLFCLPASIRDPDLPAAISRFIDARPEARQWPAPLVIIAALKTAFPCQLGTPPAAGPSEKDKTK